MSNAEFNTEDMNGYKTPFFYVVTILVGVAISLSGWSLMLSVEHSNKIATMETSQFTKEDASAMKIELMEEMRDGFDEVKRCVRGSGECD